MNLSVKSRKITGTKKGHHTLVWSFDNEKNKKFRQLDGMVRKKGSEKILAVHPKAKLFSNKKKSCWEVIHPEGLTLFKIVLRFSHEVEGWVFSIFNLKKNCWKDSENLSSKSLCSTIDWQLQ